MTDDNVEYIKVYIGAKLTPSEEAAVDPGAIPQTWSMTRQKEVEGQLRYDDWTRCPHCGDIGWMEGLSTLRRIAVRCGNPDCQGLFWAPSERGAG